MASGAGGVGRTTVALLLAEQLAALRAERVAVLDASARGGTLGLRAGGQPGPGLAALLAPGTLARVAADRSATAWSQWATIEHTSRVSVIGRSPFDGPMLDPATYLQVASGLAETWPVVVVDTGTAEERGTLADAITQLASALIAVAAPGAATDAATAGWLARLTDSPVPRVGVVVPVRKGDTARTADLLATHCTEVIQLADDPALAADAALPLLPRARRATRDAATRLAAATIHAAVTSHSKAAHPPAGAANRPPSPPPPSPPSADEIQEP